MQTQLRATPCTKTILKNLDMYMKNKWSRWTVEQINEFERQGRESLETGALLSDDAKEYLDMAKESLRKFMPELEKTWKENKEIS